MNRLYHLLKQDRNSREGVITATSVLGIAVNLLSAAIKILIGVISGSVAIVSEDANNATDAATSVLTLVGTRLSAKHPTKRLSMCSALCYHRFVNRIQEEYA